MPQTPGAEGGSINVFTSLQKKSSSVTIQMKATEQYFCVAQFGFQYFSFLMSNKKLTFTPDSIPVVETLKSR